jgi:hypothetical protein
MEILKVKSFAVVIFVALVAAPLVFWLIFYGLVRYSSADVRRLVPWLRAVRWITWITATPFMLAAIGNDKFHYLFFYGSGLFSFSAGLSLSESWLKKRLGLDNLDEGWGLDRN